MSFSEDTTLDEARDWLRDRVEKGERCPLCTQFAKVYRRRLDASMAVAAIHLWRAGQRDWVDVHDFSHWEQAHLSKLRFWGLVEQMPGQRDDGSSRTGVWRLTELGEAWVLARTRVPSHARIYNNRCLGVRGEPTSIQAALGTRFNYRDMMEGA